MDQLSLADSSPSSTRYLYLHVLCRFCLANFLNRTRLPLVRWDFVLLKQNTSHVRSLVVKIRRSFEIRLELLIQIHSVLQMREADNVVIKGGQSLSSQFSLGCMFLQARTFLATLLMLWFHRFCSVLGTAVVPCGCVFRLVRSSIKATVSERVFTPINIKLRRVCQDNLACLDLP